MQITQLTIDRYRGLEEVVLGDISAQLNVVCGPPSSGKSTIARFIREMLFGTGLPHGDYDNTSRESIGKLSTRGVWGRQTIERIVERTESDHLTVATDPTGQTHKSNRWLPKIELDVFDHVFAFGFRNRPEIASLVECLQSHGFQLSNDYDEELRLESLRGRRNALQNQLQSGKHSWETVSRTARQLESEIEALHDECRREQDAWFECEDRVSVKLHQYDEDLRAPQQALRRVQAELQALRNQRESRSEIRSLDEEIEDLERRCNSSVVQQASRWLARLTANRFRRLWVTTRQVVSVEDQSGHRVDHLTLDTMAQDQVYLAICLAAVHAYRKQNVGLPMVLDDLCRQGNSLTSDQEDHDHSVEDHYPGRREIDWFENIADVLSEFSQAGHQVITTTRQERLAELLQLNGGRVYELNLVAQQRANVWDGNSSRTSRQRWTWKDVTGNLSNQVVVDVANKSFTQRSEVGKYDSIPQPQTSSVSDRTKYYLFESDDVVEVPSVGGVHASHLRMCGLRTVRDLLRADLQRCAGALAHSDITFEDLDRWQSEARLACNVADLRKFDAQVLVASGIRDPHRLARMSRSELSQRVQRYISTDSGQSLFQSGTRFERERITDWVKHVDDSGTPSQKQPPPDAAHKHYSSEAKRETVSIDDHQQFRHHLSTSDPVVDAPSIGARMSERLGAIGVATVNDLLRRSATEVADQIDTNRVKEKTVLEWQQQTTLCCRIPEIRGHDAQILVACGVTSAEQLAATTPDKLWTLVGPFVTTKEGKRIIRNGTTPDLTEVTDWISWARHSRRLDQAA